jgi:creatinine amidohydrolase
MAETIDVARMTWPEYQDRVRRGAIVLVPVGALEQHGLHLPLATDTRIAAELAGRVAPRVDGIVLPAVGFGARSLARSGGGDLFPATTNLDGGTLTALARDLVREQARHGVGRIMFLLGHGENEPFVIEGVAWARREAAEPPSALVVGWWQVVPESALAPLFPEGFPGWDREHAARVETALMMALAPDQVRNERIGTVEPIAAPVYTVLPTPAESVPRAGSLADPTGADAATGAALVELIVSRLTATIERALPRM